MNTPIISVIAALDENRGIGYKGQIPWNIPADRKWFYEKTKNHVVIVGKSTYKSILEFLGHPLKDRLNIVLSDQKNYKVTGAIVVGSIEEALALAKKKEKNGEIFFIGGGQVYKKAISLADRLYLTKVSGKFDADVYFPDYSKFKKVVYKEDVNSSNYKFTFLILEK